MSQSGESTRRRIHLSTSSGRSWMLLGDGRWGGRRRGAGGRSGAPGKEGGADGLCLHGGWVCGRFLGEEERIVNDKWVP